MEPDNKQNKDSQLSFSISISNFFLRDLDARNVPIVLRECVWIAHARADRGSHSPQRNEENATSELLCVIINMPSKANLPF